MILGTPKLVYIEIERHKQKKGGKEIWVYWIDFATPFFSWFKSWSRDVK